jgi:hypothetical protein
LVDRTSLVAELDQMGIEPAAYCLTGGLPVEKYCLEAK